MKSLKKRLKIQLFLIKKWFLLLKTDFVITSYPKTGGTWLQLMVRTLLVKHYGLEDKKIKDIFINSFWHLFKRHKKPIPRIYMTHAMSWFNEDSYRSMTINHLKFKHKKIILLIRDPKDTLVSLYFHNRYRTVPPCYSQDIGSMIKDDIYGVNKFIKYYQTWVQDIDQFKDMLIIRYEELQSNTAENLQKISEYIGLKNVERSTIEKVISLCSFDNMKEAESKNKAPLKSLSRLKNPLPEAFKVREGKVGGYKKHIDNEQISYINKAIHEKLNPIFGYPTDH